MLALLVRRRAGRRIQPRVSPARPRHGSPGPGRTTSVEDPPLHFEVGRMMVVAAGQRRRDAALQPGQHARHLPHLRHGTGRADLAGGVFPPSAHGGDGSSRRASPTTENDPPGAPEDRHQHPPRQATPAGREQPAHEQVICAVGTANTYRMSRNSYSALCADCSDRITDCSSQSVIGTCRRPIAKRITGLSGHADDQLNSGWEAAA